MKGSEAKKKCLVLEGNIGAGKSTMLKIINDYLDVQVVFEPHEKWQDVGGENLLEKFYQDTQRWGYTFQTFAFVTRVLEQERDHRENPHAVQVLERSVYSDRYCFAKNCFEMGTMTSLEWKLYQEWFSWLVDQYTTKPTGFIYMKTDPQVCYERLKKRARHEEEAVPLAYLEKLHDRHEEWLIDKKGVAPYLQSVPVLTLECNQEFETDLAQQQRLMQQVANFFDINPRVTPASGAQIHTAL